MNCLITRLQMTDIDDEVILIIHENANDSKTI
jgi:hypothetical protein